MFVEFKGITPKDPDSLITVDQETFKITIDLDLMASFSEIFIDDESVHVEVVMRNGIAYELEITYSDFMKIVEQYNQIIKNVSQLIKRN